MAQSSDYIAGYQQGWSDAKANVTNQYPVAPPPPPPDPSVMTIQPTQVITTVIDANTNLKTTTKFQLVPGKTYSFPGNWLPKNGNFDLTATGATVIITEPAGASSGIRSTKPNCTFRGGTWSFLTAGQFCLFRFQAPLCSVIGVTLTGPTIATFGMGDLGGTQALFSKCIIPITNSCSIFLTEDDNQCIGCTFAGSYGEAVFRVDNNTATPPKLPARVLVNNNTVNDLNRKGSEWRNAAAGCQMTGNTFNATYVRIGQDGMKTPGQSIMGILVTGNTWTSADALGMCLECKNGIVTAIKNVYPPISPAMHNAITVSGPLTLTVDAPNLYNATTKPANVTVTGG